MGALIKSNWLSETMPSRLRSQKSERSYRQSQLMLIVGGSIGIIALIAIVSALLFVARRDAIRDIDRSASNLIQLVNSDIRGNFALYDRVLSEIVRLDRFRDSPGLTLEARHALFFAGASAIDHLGAILRLDANGEVVEDSASVLPRSGNFSDRPYFTAHRGKNDLRLYISQPFRSRLGDHAWRLALSRRVSGIGGTFDGIVVAGMRISYFTDAFNKLALGQFSTISVLNTEGKMLARRGAVNEDNIIGVDFSSRPNFQKILSGGEGSFVNRSQIDGVERFYRFSRIEGFPLISVVAISLDEALATWRRSVWLIGSATGALTLCGVSVIVLISRHLRRQHATEAALAALARSDPLTGLFNRRHFAEALALELRRARRSGGLLALIMIDVDHFKMFNDMFGHPVGDEALRKVSGAIKHSMRRPGDCAARYGGEEFIILLPETDLDGAAAIAEHIRASIAAMEPIPDTRRITVSAGVTAGVVDEMASADALMAQADCALYEAKSRGRNRVVCFEAAAVGTLNRLRFVGGPNS